MTGKSKHPQKSSATRVPAPRTEWLFFRAAEPAHAIAGQRGCSKLTRCGLTFHESAGTEKGRGRQCANYQRLLRAAQRAEK